MIREPFDSPQKPIPEALRAEDLPSNLWEVADLLACDGRRLAFAVTRILRDFGRPPRFELDTRVSMPAESLCYLVSGHSGRFEYEYARGESNAWPPASDAGALSA